MKATPLAILAQDWPAIGERWPSWWPQCANCQHAASEHGRSVGNLNFNHGPCFVDGCECAKFERMHGERAA